MYKDIQKKRRNQREFYTVNVPQTNMHHMAAVSESSLQQISDKMMSTYFLSRNCYDKFPSSMAYNHHYCHRKMVSAQCESIQIHHHTGQFHWVSSCSIGGNIQLYDSRFKGGDLSSSLQVQLEQIYKTCITKEENEEDSYKFLEINVPAVQL